MGAPTFKEQIAADISTTFLNCLEFADTHPAQGAMLTLDGKAYKVKSCTEEAGVLAIELEAVRS